MRTGGIRQILRGLALVFPLACALAQQSEPPPDPPPAQSTTSAEPNPENSAAQPAPSTPWWNQQPKRILGIMPNYRAVSSGTVPEPPTPKQAFKIATENSFDYSAFAFTALTSAVSFGTDRHPQLGEGVEGYAGYYWRGFLDKTDGNYLVIFALPTVFHEDERFYAKGTGPFWKRAIYAASRVLITPDYRGHDTANLSELLGRGIAQGASAFYYPSQDHRLGPLAQEYGFALGRDALTDVFLEFWPDIAHIFRRHHP